MANVYNTGVFRGTGGSGGADPLVPQPLAAEIIQELPKQSVVIGRARTIQMSTLTERLPVLSVLPQAYWLNSDTGLKQSTTQQWANVLLTAYELAALVPIPNAYIDDTGFPLWDEVKPRLVEAIAYAFDAAALFGTASPFATSIYGQAESVGNVVAPTSDVGVGIANMGVKLAQQGYAANGFIAAPGFVWNLVGYRSSQGLPIYQPNLGEAPGGTLYGYQMDEDLNGSFDTGRASMLAVDWTKAIVGLRQDITFTMHEDGVISNDSGVVIMNAMQQDTTIMRVVFRAGFATANPVTRLGAYGTGQPFCVLEPITALELVGYGS